MFLGLRWSRRNCKIAEGWVGLAAIVESTFMVVLESRSSFLGSGFDRRPSNGESELEVDISNRKARCRVFNRQTNQGLMLLRKRTCKDLVQVGMNRVGSDGFFWHDNRKRHCGSTLVG